MPVAWTEIQRILLSIVYALLILIVGGAVVRAITAGIRKIFSKNRFVEEKLTAQFGEDRAQLIVNLFVNGIYYLLMLFVFVAVLQALNLPVVTEPLNRLLSVVFAYVPQLLGAAALLFVAWLVATILKQGIAVLCSRFRLDDRVTEQLDSEDKTVRLSVALADLVYWLVFIIFLPAILGALSLHGLLEPIQHMVNTVLSFVPNLFSAALLFIVGWFIAKLCKKIATNFFQAVRLDSIGSRAGLLSDEPGKSLSEILGMAVYALVLIPVVISALGVLGIDSIAQPATDMLRVIFTYIPVLFSAFVVVAFAYFFGKMVGDVVTSLLRKLGFNRILALVGIGFERLDLPLLAGQLIKFLIVLVASIEAASMVGFSSLSVLITRFLVLTGNILAGLIIIAIGLYIGNLVAQLIERSAVANAGTLGLIAKISIFILAITMGLSQMGMASEIITLAFAFLVGALAVSFAIAFGVGGRDMAARKLKELEEKMKQGPDGQDPS